MSSKDSVLIAPPHVAAIAPYQAGKPIEELAREFGLDPKQIIKLASNENPLGMPESARLAIVAATGQLGRYPDPAGFDLKQALSARWSIPQNWLTLGNGSNDILELVASALLEPGSSVVYAQHAFVVYRLATTCPRCLKRLIARHESCLSQTQIIQQVRICLMHSSRRFSLRCPNATEHA